MLADVLQCLIMAVVSIAIINLVVSGDINSAQLQADLMRQRILYDPGAIIYVDASGTAYPGIIDVARVEQAHIDATLEYLPNYGGAQISIYSENGEKRASAIVNQATYTRIKTNADAGLGKSIETTVYPIVLIDSTGRENGFLVIEIAAADEA